MKKYLLILLLLPFLVNAEGQDALSFILDAITFIKVFAVWAVVVFSTIFLLNRYRKKKVSSTFKFAFIFGTGLIALFVFSMVKFDSQPYDGPIDSMLYKDLNDRHRKQDSLWVVEGYPDSTITETTASIDTGKVGIYIWLNHEEIFVRKHTTKFNSQRQEDSVTMAIVRGWTK